MTRNVKVKVPRDVLADAELAFRARWVHSGDPAEVAEYAQILADLMRQLAVKFAPQSRALSAAVTQAADHFEDEARSAEREAREVSA